MLDRVDVFLLFNRTIFEDENLKKKEEIWGKLKMKRGKDV
jgi:hypothetical protein